MGKIFFEIYCQRLDEQEPPYPVCAEYEEQKEKVVLDVEQAIEDIAAKVHEGWIQEKLTQGFVDHPYYGGYFTDRVYCCVVCYDKTPKDKHHSDMLPYAALPEHIKEGKRGAARIMFDWLAENGYEVVKNGV